MSVEKRDYYEVLGLRRDASAEEIKKSYRQAALKYHPDRNPGDKQSEERFKEATEAYQVLSDSNNRQKYDQFGHAAFANGGMPNFGDFSSFADQIFGDLFGAFFGDTGSQRRGRARRGRDLQYNLELTLEEAAFGGEKEIIISKRVHCVTCNGSGLKKGASAENCRQCGGIGQIRLQQGFFTITQTCPVCHGEGQIITNPCENCGGSGAQEKQSKLSVKIPQGIDEGQRLKLRGEGEAGPKGASAGDLYVHISLKPHQKFERQGTELISQIAITYAQAVLGGEVEVDTLEGKTNIKIPAGTPSGKTFRLPGKGLADVHSGRRGDQHVRTYIYVPSKLSERERELLEELAQIEHAPEANEEKSFLERVKEFFI